MESNKQHNCINFGPQHSASHGALRLILELDGEVIKNVEPQVGFLHRATEKLAETKQYNQNIGYMDRLDYTSMLCNEHAYVLAIEKLLNIIPPIRAQYIRVMFDELTRILSHLFWLGTHSLDLGAMSMFSYCFREREDILDCYEAVSGARMHANYYLPGGVNKDLPLQMPKYQISKWLNKQQANRLNENRIGSLLDFIWDFTERFPKRVDEYETLLTDNRIWKQRTVGIGIISPEKAMALGFTGPMLRGSGIAWDLRKKQPYEVYDKLQFKIPIGSEGDSYDRYLVRIAEMRESNKIVRQTVAWLKNSVGPVRLENSKIVPPKPSLFKNQIGSLIHHYKIFSEGYCVPKGECYAAIEHPKGEFGIYIISDGANKPYRVKIRSASFAHLSALNEMAKGNLLSDLVTILGTQDIGIGEIDR